VSVYTASNLQQAKGRGLCDSALDLQADSARVLLNRALFALESAWHPQFRGLAIAGRARLLMGEGKNTLFMGAVARQVRALVARGVTRTALEWAKFLLSLDREDPCGMLFYIDYCALRSRQCAAAAGPVGALSPQFHVYIQLRTCSLQLPHAKCRYQHCVHTVCSCRVERSKWHQCNAQLPLKRTV
jgi:hypothetical protein